MPYAIIYNMFENSAIQWLGDSMLNTAKLIELRVKKGWDQYELAKIAGINSSVISRMERNLQSDYKLSVVIAIADALGVTVNDLISYETKVLDPEILLPALKNSVDKLSQKSYFAQKQVAAIIEAYLDTLEE